MAGFSDDSNETSDSTISILWTRSVIIKLNEDLYHGVMPKVETILSGFPFKDLVVVTFLSYA
jgi:hypothetical protein